MTSKLEQAITALSNLPVDRQEELAAVIIDAAVPTIEWSDELRAAVDEGLADAEAGRFADPAKVEATFARFRT